VVCFFSDGHLTYSRDSQDLSKSNLFLLMKGLYKNLIIIDSEGVKYQIISAKKIKSRGFFWGISIINLQNIYIEFTPATDIEHLTLEELRKEIFKQHNRHGKIVGGYLFKQEITNIKNATSAKEIIECGCNWFFEEFSNPASPWHL
jgi:hypothetical protein